MKGSRVHILWNLAGNGLPLVAALWATPLIIRGYGVGRFGYISLFWALIGSFSLFDMGLSRVLTHHVARSRGETPGEGTPAAVAWGLIAITGSLGLLGGIALYAIGLRYFDLLPVHDPEITRELRNALPWIAAAIPLTTVASACRGVLEGMMRFTAINLIRTPVGILAFAGLLLDAVMARGLEGAAFLLFTLRVFLLAGNAAAAAACLGFRDRPPTSFGSYRPLLVSGGWMTMSNVLSPLLVYLDRILLGLMVAPAQLAYYATSVEMTSRTLFIPGSVSGVLYPAVAADATPEAIRRSVRRASGLLVPLFLLPCAALGWFAQPLLAWWIDSDFARSSFRIMQILCIGVAINGYAHLPFATVQGMGRPDVTGKIHLAEFVAFPLLLALFTSRWGTAGAAAAWSIRAAADLVLMAGAAQVLLRARSAPC